MHYELNMPGIKKRENSVKCIKMHHFPDAISSLFSGSVPILECQKVGLLSKISFSSKFSSSARVMSVSLIYQSILVDKDDLVHGRRRQGASSGVHSIGGGAGAGGEHRPPQ